MTYRLRGSYAAAEAGLSILERIDSGGVSYLSRMYATLVAVPRIQLSSASHQHASRAQHVRASVTDAVGNKYNPLFGGGLFTHPTDVP